MTQNNPQTDVMLAELQRDAATRRGKGNIEIVDAGNPYYVGVTESIWHSGESSRRRKRKTIAIITRPPHGTLRHPPPPPSPIRLSSLSLVAAIEGPSPLLGGGLNFTKEFKSV